MNAPNDPPRTSSAPDAGGSQALADLLSGSGVRHLADSVETIRDAYLDVSPDSSRRLGDQLTSLAAQLREPPEGVDPASLVLETDRLLGEVESQLTRTRRGG